ncbi:dipeptide epimerase [Terrilactibacillus sp. BCM23-1]|uniref:Dipeptide epimerase n=1 Tax=Terrilactibacillus tamarindi TaxID=2599694 RepID=A0A6N8CRY8_9BACI|nr:dipeptide epimerase [Terrilactibacillus tamarindi]MTT32952.1 dipeptide epimerase [Terrilactibacillus tamarindi]
MKITNIRTDRLIVPLIKPFKTALRTVNHLETVIVFVECENKTGVGEAPATHVITGDSLESIQSTIENIFRPLMIGMDIMNYEQLFEKIDQAIIHHSSAKACIDMAIYDLLSQKANLPLYQLLGGYRHELETDFTVSVNEPQMMIHDAIDLIDKGFNTLKIKVGKGDIETDLERIEHIRRAIGPEVRLRLDANQGWTVKEAIYAIHYCERNQLNIELIEQPVPAWDIEGLKEVTKAVETPIMADESVFTPHDAMKLLSSRSCDLINVKLMKSGGIHHALEINHFAEAYGVECMVGSMIESKIGITAAAHFAASQKNVTRCDFDAPLMLLVDPVEGGITYQGRKIFMPTLPGLGIRHIDATCLSKGSVQG